VNESLLAANAFTKNGTGTLTLNGSTAFGGTTSLLLAGGIVQGPATALPSSISTAPSSEVRFVQGTTGIYAGSITGAGGMLKTGPGTLLLTGQHSYNGMTTVAQGTLRLSGLSTALQSDISNSGTVEFLEVEYGTYSRLIFGTGTLRKIGSGTLRLTNTLDHQGATIIDGGTLQMDGTVSLSTFSVSTGSTLAGNGSVRVANVQAGAQVSPGPIGAGGVSAPGVLTADIVSMQAGATLAIDVNGPNAGAGYDRLASMTRVELNGATLHVTIGGSPAAFTPAPGSTFVIVSNAIGTFAGLPEGAAVQAGARRFRMTYAGGDGNDVALVAEGAPSITGLIDRTTEEDVTLGPLAFNIDDDLSAAGTVIVSAASSNQSVVTNAGVSVGPGGSGGGSGGAHTLTITPIANAFGTTTIAVRVEDEAGLNTQQTFVVTVTAVNDVPAITAMPNQAAAEDGPPLVCRSS
jgi:fibronectin-binding autotransporter adhesin